MIDEKRTRWLRGLFDSQQFMKWLGVEIASFSEGSCELTLERRPELEQHMGIVHAGVISALADNAAGGAASTLMPEGTAALTVEFKINFLAPAVGDRLVARAEVIRSGRSLTICESRVSAVAGNEETLSAVALVTLWPAAVEAADPTGATAEA